jgi:hypothetical protein
VGGSQVTGLAIFLLIAVGFAASVASGPVSRQRVERFARRQRLTVTAANGDQIIRYLATTRRWRAAGIVVGYGFAALVSLAVDGIGNATFSVLFAGWFAGALVAEGRVAHLAHGPRRFASMQPRRPTSYLPRTAWALVPAAGAIAVVVSAAVWVGGARGWADPDPSGLVWLVVALAVAGTVRAIQLIVLRRPQPLLPADLIAADDAIRSRSLHVLAGGGAAIVALCVLAELGTVHPVGTEFLEPVRGFGIVVVLILGWAVATSRWPARADDPVPTGPPLGSLGPG